MYSHPDPTFNRALMRELREQGKNCGNCRHNNLRQKQCNQGNKRWPEGPCIHHDDGQTVEDLFK